MKNNLTILLAFSMILFGCEKEEINGNFKFVLDYTTTVVVGGVAGTANRTFTADEIYEGTDSEGETITIRIAEHSELNEDCPNSWCYQEFLNVPREFLKLTE